MLKIRLQKTGKKNAPSYRVVLVEHTFPPQGKFIEILGLYNPRLKEKSFKADRIKHWISKGAQVSPTVHNLLINDKIIEGEKIKAWRPKKKKEKPEVKTQESTEQKPEASEEKPETKEEPEIPKAKTEEKLKEPENVSEEIKQEAEEIKEELKEEVKQEKTEGKIDK